MKTSSGKKIKYINTALLSAIHFNKSDIFNFLMTNNKFEKFPIKYTKWFN